MPPLGGLHQRIVIPFGTEKLEWCGYPNCEKSLKICLAISAEYWRATDRDTDILPQHSLRYADASHGKKANQFCYN